MRQAYATGRINQISILLSPCGRARGVSRPPPAGRNKQSKSRRVGMSRFCLFKRLFLVVLQQKASPLKEPLCKEVVFGCSEHAGTATRRHSTGKRWSHVARRRTPISGSPLWFFSEAALELYKDPWKGLLHLRRPRCLDQNTPYRRKVRGAGGRECHTPAPLGLCKSLVLALVPIGWQYERPAHRLRPRVWASFRQGQVPVGR